MPISVPPAGLTLDGVVPNYGGMKTGNLILNGDMEGTEYYSAGAVWRPSLFTLGVESTSAGAWSRLVSSPYAGTYSLQAILTALKTNKPAYCYQEIPLNPGCQVDQLQLWHRCKFWQNCDAGLVSTAKVYVSFDLVLSAGTLRNVFSWTTDPYTGWLQRTREFRPSDYATAADMLDAVSLRVTLNVWPQSDVAGPVSYVARFDDFTFEAEAAFTRNFSIGGVFDHERDSVYERGTDRSRTMYQASSGQGTAKRQGSIPFRLITEAQRDDLHGLWLYGGRQYVIWYPVMATYPESVNVILDRKWSFPAANPNVDVGFSGTLGWMEY